MTHAPKLAAAITRFRGPVVTEPAQRRVDRTGGRWNAGIIRDVSVVTTGEALGHGLWLDGQFIEDVHTALAKAGAVGVKSRFTHPDMSADGLAHYLGRFENPRREGARTIADLHFAPSAHKTPDGDLAGYLMDRANEDPASFGASITFDRDFGAEGRFATEHADEAGEFISPDEANANHYPHARLDKLHTIDIVDEPAANPDGLFHTPLTRGIDQTAAYALGLTDTAPQGTALDLNPDRLRAYVTRFMQRNRLRLAKEETTVPPDQPAATNAPAPAEPAPEQAPEPVAPDAAGATATEPTTPNPTPTPAPEPTPDAGGATSHTPPTPEPLRQLREFAQHFGEAAAARHLLAGRSLLEAALAELAATRQAAEREAAAQRNLLAATTKERDDARLALAAAQTAAAGLTAQQHPTPLGATRDADPTGKPKQFRDLFRIRN